MTMNTTRTLLLATGLALVGCDNQDCPAQACDTTLNLRIGLPEAQPNDAIAYSITIVADGERLVVDCVVSGTRTPECTAEQSGWADVWVDDVFMPEVPITVAFNVPIPEAGLPYEVEVQRDGEIVLQETRRADPLDEDDSSPCGSCDALEDSLTVAP